MHSMNRHRRLGQPRSSFARKGPARSLALFTGLLGISVGAVTFARNTPPSEQPVVITIETADNILYRGDVFHYSKLVKDPNPTRSVNSAFVTSINPGDIRPLYQAYALPMRANPLPGPAIADVTSTGIMQCIRLILSPDGKFIGTLIVSGAAPSPADIITGGSGAFPGVTGLHGGMQTIAGVQRRASTSEYPAVSRILGDGRMRTVLTLYPKFCPTVITTPSGPAAVHNDGKVVSASNRARTGETLTLYATGLGPTTPRVMYPGPIDGYQGNFRLAAPLTAGNATLRLAAAWIPGPEIMIAKKYAQLASRTKITPPACQ